MREIGLVEHVVGAQDLEGEAGAGLLEPERRVDLTVEIFAGPLEREIRVLERRAEVGPLPVERLEEVRDPADATLDRNEIERRIPLAYSGGDEFDDVTRVGGIHLDGVLDDLRLGSGEWILGN